MGEIKELTVAGAGVAGSYFYALFTDKFPKTKLKIYDGAKKRGCGCAWGCFYSLLKEKLDKVGLNIEDYILCRNRGLILNGIYFPLRNQISINKPKLVNDLCPQKKVIRKWVRVGSYPATPRLAKPRQTPPCLTLPSQAMPSLASPRQKEITKKSDLKFIINATGIPLVPHYVIPTKQYRVKIEGLEPTVNYIHLDPKYVGYGWAFSLDEEGRWFHLGAGCVNADPEILIKALVRRYRCKVKKPVCSCSRPIRVVNPEEFSPILGTVISIGEAGGYVFPVTGEGIIPSMDSAEFLVESMQSSYLPVNILPYDGPVEGLKYFYRTKEYFKKWNYDKAFKAWRLMFDHPRTAWLYGFRFMLNRAKKRARPETSPMRMVKAVIKMALGGRV